MPLVECPDCLHQISDAAPACPHCGRPFRPVVHPTHAPSPPPTVYVKDTVMTRNRGCGDLILILLGIGAAVTIGGCALLAGLSR